MLEPKRVIKINGKFVNIKIYLYSYKEHEDDTDHTL